MVNSQKFIFFKPHLKEVVWAGQNLSKVFNTQNKIGEAWLLSTLEGKESICTSANFLNQNLKEIFDNNPHLFNNFKTYPNLSKIIDTDHPLSVQVHPNDEQAEKYKSFGKEECWYVLDTQGNNFILGHNANSKEQAIKMIKNNQWDELLKTHNVQKGDFLYVPSGEIHAIPAKTTVFEMQQSSDITFRLYDYDRLDLNNQKRELHISESCEALSEKNNYFIKPKGEISLVENNFFNLKVIENKGETTSYHFDNPNWIEIFVIEGKGLIDEFPIQKYNALILTSKQNSFSIKGKVKLIINIV